MIVEIECLPNPPGTAGNRYAHVEAAIAVIEQSGLNYQVGALGTTFEGPPDRVWPLVRAVHEACLAAGAAQPGERRQDRPIGERRARRWRAWPGSSKSHECCSSRTGSRFGGLRRAAPSIALTVVLVAVWQAAVTAVRGSQLHPAGAERGVGGVSWRCAGCCPPTSPRRSRRRLADWRWRSLVAVPVASLVATFGWARRAILPILVVSQNIPMIVLAPLLVVWFGFGITPKLLVVALIGFFPIAVSTADGLLNADRELIDLIRAMGGSRWQRAEDGADPVGAAAVLRRAQDQRHLRGACRRHRRVGRREFRPRPLHHPLADRLPHRPGAGRRGRHRPDQHGACSWRPSFLPALPCPIATHLQRSINNENPRLAASRRAGRPRWRPSLPLSGAAVADDLTPVTLMLNWTPNNHHAGIYIALANGWYKDVGIDLKVVEPAAAGADQVVGAGSADFGISQAESVIPARANGIPVVSIATILPYDDSSLMALASEGITRPRDLEGKTYGGYGGPLETELIDRLVKCDGGDPSKVKFVEVGNIDYVAGLEQKRFDFVWVFEGWDALRAREVLHKQISTLKFVDYLQCIPDWYTPVFITNEATIRDRPELVEKFLAATARGYRRAIEDPDEAAADLLKAVPELDPALVKAAAALPRAALRRQGRAVGHPEARDLEGLRRLPARRRADRQGRRSGRRLHQPLPRHDGGGRRLGPRAWASRSHWRACVTSLPGRRR